MQDHVEAARALAEDEEAMGRLRADIERALDYRETEYEPLWFKALRYLEGFCDVPAEDGRSSVVMTRVRDAVRHARPALLRALLTNRPVEFLPTSLVSAEAAEQATDFVHAALLRADGFNALRAAIDDAVALGLGIIHTTWEDHSEVSLYRYNGVTPEQIEALLQDGAVLQAVEQREDGLLDAAVFYARQNGRLCIRPVPVEDFFIDPAATSIDEARYFGLQKTCLFGDLQAQGYDPDAVERVGQDPGVEDDTLREIKRARRGHDTTDQHDVGGDPNTRRVRLTELYVRMKVADGMPLVLHRVLLGGASYIPLSVEPADGQPLSLFMVDPVAHRFYGRSVSEILFDDQNAATAIMRSILDNVTMVNNPRFAVVDSSVNMADMLNGEIGGIVRVKAPGMVQVLDVPFVAGQTLPALQYLDAQSELRSGLTRAAAGLDPDAMQSTTREAVRAQVEAATAQTELMVRNLAETGLRHLYTRILSLTVRYTTAEQRAELLGRADAIDPRVWRHTMQMRVNVGVGNGRVDEQVEALDSLLAFQMGILQNMGLQNPFVTLRHISNAMQDRVRLAGLPNGTRYLNVITPEVEQQIMQELAAQQQQAMQAGAAMSPEAMAIVQGEQIKAQAKLQSDAARVQAQMEKDREKADLERDRLLQDLIIKAAELEATHGIRLDILSILRAQAATSAEQLVPAQPLPTPQPVPQAQPAQLDPRQALAQLAGQMPNGAA
jgi:hypothetical protein